RRALGVGRAVRAGSGAHLSGIAVARRRATDREAAQEAIRGAGRARPRARLDVVAGAPRGTARRARVPCRMLAGVAAAVALIHATGVPVARARRARRPLAVGRATGARPGAVLVDVARARGGPADGARVARRVLAGVAAAVALVAAARIAVVRARRAGRALRVGRARGRRAGAALGRVAFARRPATHDEARLEHVGGAGGAGPGAVLVHVAGTGRRAADGAQIARRMLAGVARSVAPIGAARVPVVGTRRARRCLG